MECCGTETETSNSPCDAAHWKDAPAQDHDEPCTPGSDSGQALLDLVLESRYGQAQSYLEPVPELSAQLVPARLRGIACLRETPATISAP